MFERIAVVGVVLTVVAVAVGCSSTDEKPAAVAPPAAEAAPMPEPRTEVAGTAWQGLVIAVGGLTADGRARDRVDLYDPATNSWRPGPPLPTPLHHVGVATIDDRVYVAGGYAQGLSDQAPGGGWQPQAGVLSLGPGESAWRQEPPLGTPRGALALAAASGRLVAIGGVNEGAATRSTEVFEPGAPAWRPGPALAQAREHLGGAGAGGRVYAVGGRVGTLESNLRSVESWDPAGSEGWRSEPSLQDARGGDGAAAADVGGTSTVCVAGGEAVGGTIGSVECLQNGRWEKVAELAIPRHGLAVAGLDGVLHVAGGGPTPGLSVSGAHEVFVLG